MHEDFTFDERADLQSKGGNGNDLASKRSSTNVFDFHLDTRGSSRDRQNRRLKNAYLPLGTRRCSPLLSSGLDVERHIVWRQVYGNFIGPDLHRSDRCMCIRVW